MDFVGITQYSFQHGNQSFYIGKFNFITMDLRLNLILSIALEIALNIVELALIIDISADLPVSLEHTSHMVFSNSLQMLENSGRLGSSIGLAIEA
jgi:hypothetical protein